MQTASHEMKVSGLHYKGGCNHTITRCQMGKKYFIKVVNIKGRTVKHIKKAQLIRSLSQQEISPQWVICGLSSP